MNALSFQALNCNSIVRTDTQKTLSSPFLSLLKKTNDICLFSDVRVSDERFSFLSVIISLLFSDDGSDPRGPWCYIYVCTAFANDFFLFDSH